MNNDHHSEGATAGGSTRAAVSTAKSCAGVPSKALPQDAAARPRYCAESERAFIAAIGPYCMWRDLAAVLNRSDRTLAKYGWKHSRSQQPLSRAGVREAWRRWQAGEDMKLDLLMYWQDERGTHQRRPWTLHDDSLLEEMLGNTSMPMMARLLGRTQNAIDMRIIRLGLQGRKLESTAYALARELGIDRRNIYNWLDNGRLRGFRTGRYRIVDMDDFVWMCENYRKYKTFPPRPGELGSAELVEQIEARDDQAKEARRREQIAARAEQRKNMEVAA